MREPDFPRDDVDAFIAWVEHMNGDMLQAALALDGPFDLIFIDADKIHYPEYARWAMDHLRPSGLLLADNAYLFGHAWSTFKPLHDAYVAKRLHTGMLAYYADGSGRVRTYKVTAIKVVTPDQTAWAIAAQAKPSMTLQTCVGSRSQYRLLVRLVAIN